MIRPLEPAFEGLDEQYDDGARKLVEFDFDSRPSQSSRVLDRMKMDLIQSITDEQRNIVQGIVRESFLAGEPPATTARRIKEAVGLTPAQVQHVANFRRELEEGSSKALGRALRDKRYDASIRKAIESGEPLPEAKISDMVAAYKRRYVAFRAMNIARTESLRAASLGHMEAVRDGIKDGTIDPQTVVKRWIATKDGKTRDTHRELDGKEVRGIDSPFVTRSGAILRHPHDPDAPASETINCRCTLAIDIKSPRF
jgi:hypothetical protein